MKNLGLWIRTIAAWLVTLIVVFPLIWLVLTAFKTEQQAIAIPPQLFFTPTLESFAEVNLRSEPQGDVLTVLDLDAKVLPILKEAGIAPRPLAGSKIDDRISRINVRHLMDHTSGLPNETTYTAWRPGCNVAARHGLDHVATGADVAADGLGNARLHAGPVPR